MLDRTTTLIAVFSLLALAGCDPRAAARKAYVAGRFEEAHAAFAEEVASAGEDASADLLYDRGLAALRAGMPRVAEESAERAAVKDPRIDALADFLRGNALFGQCELADLQAGAAEAEPFAMDIAIRYGERAQAAWERAAMSREDWPAARRNAARARLKVADLRRRRTETEARRFADPDAVPVPVPEPGAERDPVEEEPDAELGFAELSEDEVWRLFDRLTDREQEKLELRRAEGRMRGLEVERDW